MLGVSENFTIDCHVQVWVFLQGGRCGQHLIIWRLLPDARSLYIKQELFCE